MGRKPENKTVTFNIQGKTKNIDIETFTWEKLDCQDDIKAIFNL